MVSFILEKLTRSNLPKLRYPYDNAFDAVTAKWIMTINMIFDWSKENELSQIISEDYFFF